MMIQLELDSELLVDYHQIEISTSDGTDTRRCLEDGYEYVFEDKGKIVSGLFKDTISVSDVLSTQHNAQHLGRGLTMFKWCLTLFVELKTFWEIRETQLRVYSLAELEVAELRGFLTSCQPVMGLGWVGMVGTTYLFL